MNHNENGDRHVLVEREGSIVTVTLNRPASKNLISSELTSELVQACADIQADPSVKCAILAARGDVFCAGGNLKAMRNRQHHFAGSPSEIRSYYDGGVQRLARAFFALDVPVVAAINGAAMGAGLDLALMCDLRVASSSAIFAESFVRVGLVSGAGGSWLLQQTVGSAMAAELTLTGDTIDAQRALQIGLVSRVVAPDDLARQARELAERVARHPSHAVRMNKRLLRDSRGGSLESVLTLAASLQGLAQHTEDHIEAVAAALEKRPAQFKNK